MNFRLAALNLIDSLYLSAVERWGPYYVYELDEEPEDRCPGRRCFTALGAQRMARRYDELEEGQPREFILPNAQIAGHDGTYEVRMTIPCPEWVWGRWDEVTEHDEGCYASLEDYRLLVSYYFHSRFGQEAGDARSSRFA